MTEIEYPHIADMEYAYDATGAMTTVSEVGGDLLATYAYDDLGRRASITRANGVVTTYGYDGVSRLTMMAHDLAHTVHDQSWTVRRAIGAPTPNG